MICACYLERHIDELSFYSHNVQQISLKSIGGGGIECTEMFACAREGNMSPESDNSSRCKRGKGSWEDTYRLPGA